MAYTERPSSSSLDPQSPAAVELPQGLAQNGGRIDVDNLGLLRPSAPWLPLDELRRRFEEDGYLFVKGLLPCEDVLDARENYFKAYANTSLLQSGSSPRNGIFNKSSHSKLHKGIGGQVLPADPIEARILIDAHADSKYHAFVEHPALMQFIQRLMGWEQHVLMDRAMLCHDVPFGMGAGIHYDKLFLRRDDGYCLTAWVPIGDFSINGGGLCYLDKSVTLGNEIEEDYTTRAAGLTTEQRLSAYNINMMAGGMLAKSPDEFVSDHPTSKSQKWLATNYEAGDVVFHHPYTIHASGRDEDAQRRRRTCFL